MREPCIYTDKLWFGSVTDVWREIAGGLTVLHCFSANVHLLTNDRVKQ